MNLMHPWVGWTLGLIVFAGFVLALGGALGWWTV